MSSRPTLIILQSLIPKCWSIDPKQRKSSYSILRRLRYVGLESPDPPSVQPPHDQKHAEALDVSVMILSTNTSLSILSEYQLEQRGYYRVKITSRIAEGWVSGNAPEPEVVFRCNEDGFHPSVSPNGKWLAVNYQATSQLWDLVNLSSPPVNLPARGLWARYEWSPDSRYLACFDGNDLYIWSIKVSKILCIVSYLTKMLSNSLNLSKAISMETRSGQQHGSQMGRVWRSKASATFP